MTAPLRQVALLRGINVGGHKRIAMAQLRQLLRDLGFTDVATHLQSGNAVFTSPLVPTATGAAIEQGLVRVLGVEARVVMRTHAELVAAVDADPLGAVATDPSRHFVGFLSGAPQVERLQAVTGLLGHVNVAADQVHLVGDHLYLWCPRGILDSVFSAVNWDRRLGVTTTMRNWNTVTKLVDLSHQ